MPLNAAQLRIAVASNFLAPARALALQFEAQTGHQVRVSSGSTGKLYAQITQGAPFDLFLAANSREPQRLVKSGKAVDRMPYTYALGRLVLWSADPERLKHDDPRNVLATGTYRRLALANPRTAPYGMAAMSVLKGLGLEQDLANRLVRAESVTQAYQYLVTGNAELGFIAQSQLLLKQSATRGSQWRVPEALYPPIRQQAVLLKRARDKPVAEAFLAYLQRPETRRLIETYGYGME